MGVEAVNGVDTVNDVGWLVGLAVAPLIPVLGVGNPGLLVIAIVFF